MLANDTVDVGGRRGGNQLDGKTGELANGIAFYYASGQLQLKNTNRAIVIHIPSFGSATAKDTFFSSLISSRRLDRRGETFPSTNEATSSRAVAALSNFWKLFSFNLHMLLVRASKVQKIFLRGLNRSSLSRRKKLDSQIRHALWSSSLSGQILSLQELLVLCLEQGITCACFGKDKERHGGRRNHDSMQNLTKNHSRSLKDKKKQANRR